MLCRTYDIGFKTNFEHITSNSAHTQKFTILYTHGFCSDPWGRKPEEVKKWCLKNNIAMYRYELAGHGSDIARFEETDINIYKAQILEIIDKYIEGDIVVVGSSLGGWLSLLAAVNRKDRIKGVVGLAAAPDFTIDHMKYATPAQIEEMQKFGKISYPGQNITFTVTKRLIDSGNENLILDKDIIPIECPVVLVQGMQDTSVDWHKALQIAKKLKTPNVKIKLLKNANHRLNEDSDIQEILSALDSFL
ncbi:MAG: alpha/beta fold hydrolase [Alphaproteobacteria bacterium]|nr:alpha/beta fold hydrolase [Alphaproteobacteria bacterium]